MWPVGNLVSPRAQPACIVERYAVVFCVVPCVWQDIMGVVPLVKHAFSPLVGDVTELLSMSQIHLSEKNFGVGAACSSLSCPLPCTTL